MAINTSCSQGYPYLNAAHLFDVRFVDGVLKEGKAVNIVGERCNNGMMEIKTIIFKEGRKIVWAKQETNA